MDYLSPLRSELKLKILLSLLNGERKIADLRSEVETRDTTILHVLEEFDDLNLIAKNQGFYTLTPLGIIEAKIFKDYIATTEVIEKFKDFWLLHDITDIPVHLLQNMGALKDAQLVRTDATELGIVHKTVLETLKTSKMIKGISPIFHPDFISMFGQLLDQGCTIELIVSGNVLRKIKGVVEIELVKKYFEEDKLRFFLKDDLKVALALTSHSFSLGLFSLSGKYDDSMDLLSESAESIEWGERLFDDMARCSQRIGLDLIS